MCRAVYNPCQLKGGKRFEAEALGQCTALFGGQRPKFWDATRLVKKNQPPAKTQRVKEYEQKLSEMLGEPVVFYTAVNSALDICYGVDGFFEFRGVIVKIDITQNRSKNGYKADVVLHQYDTLNDFCARVKRAFCTLGAAATDASSIRVWRAA